MGQTQQLAAAADGLTLSGDVLAENWDSDAQAKMYMNSMKLVILLRFISWEKKSSNEAVVPKR